MNKDGFIIVGMLIYLVTSIVNRFFVAIPDAVYIPLAVVGIVLMIVVWHFDYRRLSGFMALFLIIKHTHGLRVEKRIEEEGLDIYEHGETAYN